jgi:hypothetical protein
LLGGGRPRAVGGVASNAEAVASTPSRSELIFRICDAEIGATVGRLRTSGRGRTAELGQLNLHFAAGPARRPRDYLRLGLLPLVAALGSLASYGLPARSHAATATTLPRPDPRPASTLQRVSPPPPAPPRAQTYVAPPLPSTPAQTYATPPTPSPSKSVRSVPLTPPRKHRPARIVRHRDQSKRKATARAAASFRLIPPRELPRGAVVGVAVVPVVAVDSAARARIPLPLWVMLALSLVVLAFALTPPRVLPASVGIVLAERRQALVYAGIAALLGIGVGFLIASVGS